MCDSPSPREAYYFPKYRSSVPLDEAEASSCTEWSSGLRSASKSASCCSELRGMSENKELETNTFGNSFLSHLEWLLLYIWIGLTVQT